VWREDTDEVLVTQDKHKVIHLLFDILDTCTLPSIQAPVWKFPGGLSELGEDIGRLLISSIMQASNYVVSVRCL